MPNFFYLDANGQKQGPVTPQQLKALAAQGSINPNTPLETEGGHKGVAGQIPGLQFGSTAPQPAATQPTSKYYYIDANGQRQGPVTSQQLKALAAQGVINPQTPLMTESGHKGLAGQIPGLFAAPPSPFVQPQPVPYNAAVQYVPTNHPSNPLPIILLVGLLVVGTICFGVGCHGLHWDITHYVDAKEYCRQNNIHYDESMAKYLNRPSNDAFQAATVFLVIAGGLYIGAFFVFTRFIKRKQE